MFQFFFNSFFDKKGKKETLLQQQNFTSKISFNRLLQRPILIKSIKTLFIKHEMDAYYTRLKGPLNLKKAIFSSSNLTKFYWKNLFLCKRLFLMEPTYKNNSGQVFILWDI